MTNSKLLPRRIVVAASGRRAIVLRGQQRHAADVLRTDVDLLMTLGFGDFIVVEAHRYRVRFASGGLINYIGGPEEVLEQRLRGMSAEHIDGEELVHPGLIAVVTRS